jgi:hypothetical protein
MREVSTLSLRIPETTTDPASDSVGGDAVAPPKEPPPTPCHRLPRCWFSVCCVVTVVLALAIGLGVGLAIKRNNTAGGRRYVPRNSITVQLQVPATGLTPELGAALRCAFLATPPPSHPTLPLVAIRRGFS